MSWEYDNYLHKHKENVAKAFYWIRDNLPELIIPLHEVNYEHQICIAHDASKDDMDEYVAYDRYFYGGNRSYAVVEEFNYAWLEHIHKNKHHWQHYVLIQDEPNEGMVILDMPYNYILEMVCDWWAFSWNEGKLTEIFDWYNEHKDYMKLSTFTRNWVKVILDKISVKLIELDAAKVEEV